MPRPATHSSPIPSLLPYHRVRSHSGRGLLRHRAPSIRIMRRGIRKTETALSSPGNAGGGKENRRIFLLAMLFFLRQHESWSSGRLGSRLSLFQKTMCPINLTDQWACYYPIFCWRKTKKRKQNNIVHDTNPYRANKKGEQKDHRPERSSLQASNPHSVENGQAIDRVKTPPWRPYAATPCLPRSPTRQAMLRTAAAEGPRIDGGHGWRGAGLGFNADACSRRIVLSSQVHSRR